MSTTIDYTFEWPAGPNDVIVTGEFDDWRGSLPLLKTSSGEFELTFPVKIPADKDKVFFKYIVDGNWVTSDAYNKGFDETGIENNYVSKSEAQALSENPSASKIPEAGGLAFASVNAASEAKKTEDKKPEFNAVPTIAPKTASVDEPKTVTQSSTTTKAVEPAVLDFSTTAATKTEDPEPSATKTVSEPKPAATPTIATKTASVNDSKPSTGTGNATITAQPQTTGTTKIPEAGGLGFATKASAIEPTQTASSSESKKRFKVKRRIRRNKATGEKVVVSEEHIPLDPDESTPEHVIVEEESLKSRSNEPEETVHILPIDDASQSKEEKFNPLAGGPGPVIPQNASEIKEFSEVRDVDAKALNERLNGESAAEENPEATEAVQATLDPNTKHGEGENIKKVESKTKSKAEPEADTAAAVKKEAQASSSKPAKKSSKKPTVSPPKTEEKKKKTGFFSKLKKVLQ